jgi:hypothetical protein
MLVRDHKVYNREFPELFNWGMIDSPKYSEIASEYQEMIRGDLKTANRNITPGLREALRVIANIATF